MAKAQITECVQTLFEACCFELFQSLDCVITKINAADFQLDEVVLSYIDAGSDDIDLIVVLRVPSSILAMTYPEFESDDILSVDETQLEDWIAELANQLMGRLKNKLLNFGCRIKIGLPTTFFDIRQIDLPVTNHDRLSLQFDVDKEPLELLIYSEIFNEDIVLTPPPEEDTSTGEGELELF